MLLGSIGVVLLTGGAEFRASLLGTVVIPSRSPAGPSGSQWSRRLTFPSGALAGFAAEMLGGAVLLLASAQGRGLTPRRLAPAAGIGPTWWCSAP